MNSLTIQPTFQARYPQTKQIRKNTCIIRNSSNTRATEKSSFWSLADRFITNYIKSRKKDNYSKEPISYWIEKNLENQGVNVRFKNNSKLAQYIQTGIDILNEKKIELPKNILFMSPIFSKLGIFGLTYMLSDKKESPIILPKNIGEISEREICKKRGNYFSSRSRLHIFFHEVGHWLHHQTGFDIEKNTRIWNTINKEEIAKKVSKQAIQCEDGSDFCAEVFASQILDNELDDNIIELAKKLNAPLIK